jgi:hypothetical protein
LPKRLILPYPDKIRIIISGCFPTGGNAVGVGKACDGFVIHPQERNPGLFCRRQPGQCFIADISGTCARKPRFCPQITGRKLVVCGCDGKTYGNDCMRQQAGFRWRTRGSAYKTAAG